MCIVTLENTYPKRSGTSELLYNLAMGLVDLGFEVSMVSFINRYQREAIPKLSQFFYHDYARIGKPPYTMVFKRILEPFRISGNAIRANISAKFFRFLRRIFDRIKTEVVLIGTCWPAPISVLASRTMSIPSVLYLNAIESDPQHGLNLANRAIARFCEGLGIKFSEKTTIVSREDKEILLRRGVPEDKLELLPNPVDCRKYDVVTEEDKRLVRRRLGIGTDPVIAFVGGLDYPPNRLAVRRIYEEIAPQVLKELPNAKFCIIGPYPPREYRHPSIIYPGGIYGGKLAPYIAMADVGIAPIEWGTGTRSKILEYFAAGLAVVSTSIGARGLDVHDGKDILIVDDYDEFSRNIIELLADEKKRRKLGNNAHSLVLNKYCRDVVVKKLATILESVVSGEKI